jgi:electron transfer flavoprotein alpha subunit
MAVLWASDGWRNDRLSPLALEVIEVARQCGSTQVVAFADTDLPVDLFAGLQLDGVAVVSGTPPDASPEACVVMLTGMVRDRGAEVVVMAADPRGREIGPRLASRLRGAALNDVVGVVTDGGDTRWLRPVFGGLAVAELSVTASPAVVTVRSRAFAAAKPQGSLAPELTHRPFEKPDITMRLCEARRDQGDAIALEDARVIVSAGRGVGTAENFKRVQEIAELLGGVVAGTGAAVDAGWITPDRKIGLTGKVVAPDVYIAIGISGASQHTFGTIEAKTVIAINSDATAPIFKDADIGFVADLNEVLQPLVDSLRRSASRAGLRSIASADVGP